MKITIAVTALIVGILVFSISYFGRRTGQPPAEKAVPSAMGSKTSPVIVELFTSEGCSSCPPADKLLESLAKTQPIHGATVIALEQHVDYWNQLGWEDPYSSEQFSSRQQDYSTRFGANGVYTPQMVVDGNVEFVGSNVDKAREAITKASSAAKAVVQLSLKPETAAASTDVPVQLSAHFKEVPASSEGDRVQVMLAITENDVRSNITRGENSGLNLSHIAVVRHLEVVTDLNASPSGDFDVSPSVAIGKGWKRENLQAVVFLQERASRRILGAAAISLAR